MIWRKAATSGKRWTKFVRGDVVRLWAPLDARGSEQHGARYAVVVQSDDLLLSTGLIAPTSRSAQPRIFRPTIVIGDNKAQVLVEQTTAVALQRLGDLLGRVRHGELDEIIAALRLAFELG